MSRPRYETQRDLSAEAEIGAEWAKSFNATVRKLPEGMRYYCDLAVFRSGKMRAIAEVKDRPTWKASYGTVILGLSKVRELVSYSDMGIPGYFVVRLAGTIYYTKVTADLVADWRIAWAGRTDRDDAEDVEPCVHIPFKDLMSR